MLVSFLGSWKGALVFALVTVLGAFSFASVNYASASARGRSLPRQNIVIHLGHATDDIHSADMALHMGTNLLQHGAEVTLFVDREGVRIADARLPIDSLTWAENNIGEDYEAFLAAGGRVLVCPGCAANQALTAQLLRRGAVLGTADSVGETMLQADKVIDF